jgi:hypothetical protein
MFTHTLTHDGKGNEKTVMLRQQGITVMVKKTNFYCIFLHYIRYLRQI